MGFFVLMFHLTVSFFSDHPILLKVQLKAFSDGSLHLKKKKKKSVNYGLLCGITLWCESVIFTASQAKTWKFCILLCLSYTVEMMLFVSMSLTNDLMV